MYKQDIIHIANEALTKPTVGSIGISSGGAIIAKYGGVTEYWMSILTEWAVPIGTIFTIVLGTTKFVLMIMDARYKIKAEARESELFEIDRREHLKQDTGQRTRKND